MNETVDVLVIGAGPSGTMAAAIANKSRLKVKIIEKTKFPRFVIGESLLARCMDSFEEAGVLEELKKHNFQVKNGAVFLKGEQRCEFNFSEKFTKGKDWTWQVPRDEFDKVIADKVESMGVNIDYESEVTNIQFSGTNSTTTVRDKRGVNRNIDAKFIIDASGYGRVIPKLLDLNIPSEQPNRSTIFTHFKDLNRSNTEDSNRIIAISHKPDVWIWIIPFSNGNTSCGFVGNPDYLEKYKGTPTEKLKLLIGEEPLLKGRFQDAEMVFEPVMISGYSIAVKQLHGPGYVLTGNSTEFLDPIFSTGVTLAAESGVLAGKLVVRELKGEEVDWDLEYSSPISKGIEVFRTYIDAWYDGTLHQIFFSNSLESKIKRQICSVLSGYAWDQSNPFVSRHKKSVNNLAKYLEKQKNK
jgi:flavin-dependent dehydrogenase